MRSVRSADARGDVIVALATAPGRGAVAMVRLSGDAAFDLAARVGVDCSTPPRRAVRTTLHTPGSSKDKIDDSIVVLYKGPNSFTGEDTVEFSIHGGTQVASLLLSALAAVGARPALAGEFTERAVRNGKIDLLQAEGIADLIDARSRAMHRVALQQLSGALSNRLSALRSSLIEVESLIAYDLDFPEEDDGPISRDRVTGAATAVLDAIGQLKGTLPAAELGRDGVNVVLAGSPNAGKSSLFNALLGDQRAIVSEIAGTTRDAIEALVEHDPWPLRFIDTAGLRDSADRIEQLGIEVSERRLASAHLVLVCGESEESLLAAVKIVKGITTVPVIAVRTKVDMIPSGRLAFANELLAEVSAGVAVSSTTGEGLDELRMAITSSVHQLYPDPTEESPIVTRARHVAALEVAHGEILAFRDGWVRETLPGVVLATHIRAAVHSLDELMGAIDVDEVLDRVFRSFCVGK